jgi:hypothetical protein
MASESSLPPFHLGQVCGKCRFKLVQRWVADSDAMLWLTTLFACAATSTWGSSDRGWPVPCAMAGRLRNLEPAVPVRSWFQVPLPLVFAPGRGHQLSELAAGRPRCSAQRHGQLFLCVCWFPTRWLPLEVGTSPGAWLSLLHATAGCGNQHAEEVTGNLSCFHGFHQV